MQPISALLQRCVTESPTDAAGCPSFDAKTTQAILSEWRHTDGGAASDFLAGWTPASLVVSIDLDLVAKRGPLLGIWATTASEDGQLDRIGRPLTGNALLGTLATGTVSDKLKEEYNARHTRHRCALRAGDREGARTLRRLRRQVR